MTITSVKFIIRDAEEKSYKKKVIKNPGKPDEQEVEVDKVFKRCKIQHSPYDTPFMIGCDKLVEDGVYLCGFKVEHDFDHNRDYVSLIIGDRVQV